MNNSFKINFIYIELPDFSENFKNSLSLQLTNNFDNMFGADTFQKEGFMLLLEGFDRRPYRRHNEMFMEVDLMSPQSIKRSCTIFWKVNDLSILEVAHTMENISYIIGWCTDFPVDFVLDYLNRDKEVFNFGFQVVYDFKTYPNIMISIFTNQELNADDLLYIEDQLNKIKTDIDSHIYIGDKQKTSHNIYKIFIDCKNNIDINFNNYMSKLAENNKLRQKIDYIEFN